MRTLIFYPILLFFLAVSLPAAHGQTIGNNGYYSFGLNAGWSYQTSDVRNDQDGFGLGFTLGRSLFYRPTAPLTFELRGRFLFARQYGLDGVRSYDITNNTALNGTRELNYLDYPGLSGSDEGYVYHNYRTTTGELSAELVLHFNQLRERTNFILSLYGAAGIDLYRTRLDQVSAFGNPYYDEYGQISASLSNREVRDLLRESVLDRDFETPGEGFENGPKLDFMPSAGIEIGYQLGPRFAVLFGHRTTFSGMDLLDGNQWADRTNNDWYHYTHFGLEWRIWASGRRKQRPPVITILQPQQIPSTSYNSRPVVRATILHVTNPADVTCNINGRPLNFNFFGEDFNVQPLLRPGRNEITITARNDAGMDRKQIIFMYQGTGPGPVPPPPPPPGGQEPYVRITQPNTNPFQTNTGQATVRAEVLGARSSSDVRFFVNGNREQAFSYNSGTREFVATIRLRPGENTVRVEALNPFGSAFDEVRIIYGNDQQQGPSVRFTDPDQSPYQTLNEVITVRAQVDRISSSNSLTFTVNGRENSNFSFSGSNFSATVRLSAGRNTFRLEGRNNAGQDSDFLEVIYGNSDPDPTGPNVRITRPASNPYLTDRPNTELRATITGIQGRSDIKLTVNGSTITNFTYNNRELRANLNLPAGNNTVRVQAFNPGGTDQDEVIIRYEPEMEDFPPTVRIDAPDNGDEISSARINVRARTDHIDRKDQIDLRVNGQRITAFSFNPSRGDINATVDLRNGANTIRITVSNPDGSDNDQVRVTYQTAPGPTVTITQPDNGETFQEADVELLATVRHVDSRNGISITLNGKRVSNFILRGDRLSTSVTLRSGSNTLKVRASNSAGTDEDEVRVTYRPVVLPKPTITWIAPRRPGSTVRQEDYQFQARVQNISSRNQLRITFNGNAIKSYEFQNRSGMIAVPVRLREGRQNELKITATTDGGSANESTFVRYQAAQDPPSEPGPTITIDQISQPASNPFNPNVASCGVSASTTDITSSSQISITLNGEAITNFSFQRRAGQLTFDLTIPRGSNLLRITVTNDNGSDTAESTIDF